jgi:hypothetical protein
MGASCSLGDVDIIFSWQLYVFAVIHGMPAQFIHLSAFVKRHFAMITFAGDANQWEDGGAIRSEKKNLA